MTQLRLATENDLPTVARIMTDGWKTTYAGIFPDEYLSALNYKCVEKKWMIFLADPAHFIYVAEDNGAICAFIAGNCRHKYEDCGFIESFHALPDARGKGIGRMLITSALAQFRNAGKARAMVYAIAENTRAHAIYTHLGAQIETFFTDHFDGISTNSVSLTWNLCESKNSAQQK